jgi:hypothetical protein
MDDIGFSPSLERILEYASSESYASGLVIQKEKEVRRERRSTVKERSVIVEVGLMGG